MAARSSVSSRGTIDRRCPSPAAAERAEASGAGPARPRATIPCHEHAHRGRDGRLRPSRGAAGGGAAGVDGGGRGGGGADRRGGGGTRRRLYPRPGVADRRGGFPPPPAPGGGGGRNGG